MKKPIFFFLALFLAFTESSNAQQIIKTDKEIYTIEGAYYFTITKTDTKTQKVLFKAQTKIPDKSQKEGFYPGLNNASFDLIGDNIVIVYDVWQKSTDSKDCSVKLLNVKSGTFNQPKLLYSTKLNSANSSSELIYKPIYSPDKTKLAVLKDNNSPTSDIDPEINIYDTRTFNVLSSKKISGKFEGQKRIFDLTRISMDDKGNITTLFHLIDEKTKITTKSYSADIPFNENDFINIKDLGVIASTGLTKGQNINTNKFYKTPADFLNNTPIEGYSIKNDSWSYLMGFGESIVLFKNGVKDKVKLSNLPSPWFSYGDDGLLLMRAFDGNLYYVLAEGPLCYYLNINTNRVSVDKSGVIQLTDQSGRGLYKNYYSETSNGEILKLKDKNLNKYLVKYNLKKKYDAEKMKRNTSNDYLKRSFKYIKYINLLNEQMK